MARQRTRGMEDIIRNKMNQLRHWKLTSLGKRRPKSGLEFTIMTYNILSQSAVDCHMYLYQKCNPHYLSEEYRISKLLPEILKSNSDIVCLQEVEQYVYEQRIRHVFDSNGFGCIFKKRTGNKSDGCAILWRRAKFSLLRHHVVEYRNRNCKVLDRDNVGLIAVLKPCHPQASQTQLHVATTHLIFNPRRGDVKFCQLRLLLAELERLALKEIGENGRVYHPTILCGDFNFEPHSPLYKFVENGRLDVTRIFAGNMSGQHEGKNKGGYLDVSKVSMEELGIDESGRYNDTSASDIHKPSTSRASVNVSGQSSHDSRLDSYRLLNHMMDSTQLNSKDTFADEQRPSPSSSESSSDEDLSSNLFYHDFNFVPAYKYRQDSNRYPITSMTGNDCNTVDHIFYTVREKSSTSFLEDKLKLLGTYSLPYAEDLRDLDGLPNAYLGSDHLSLMSKFIITF